MSRLRDILDDALETAPVDHWVTIAAANQLLDHLVRALEDATGGPDHLVNVKASAWTLQHPLDERFEADHGSLFNCFWNAEVAHLAPMIAASDGDGTYRIYWATEDVIRWDRVTRA